MRRVKQWAGLLARLVVGGVWIFAGAIKVTDPQASVQAVRAYQLLPGNSAETVGYLLPTIEIVVGVALVVGIMTRGAALVSSVLFVAFVVGIASIWVRGIEIDCGCFGGGGADPGASSSYPWEIARDVALLAGSLLLVWLRSTRLSLDALIQGRPHDHLDAHPDTSPDRLDVPEGSR